MNESNFQKLCKNHWTVTYKHQLFGSLEEKFPPSFPVAENYIKLVKDSQQCGNSIYYAACFPRDYKPQGEVAEVDNILEVRIFPTVSMNAPVIVRISYQCVSQQCPNLIFHRVPTKKYANPQALWPLAPMYNMGRNWHSRQCMAVVGFL